MNNDQMIHPGKLKHLVYNYFCLNYLSGTAYEKNNTPVFTGFMPIKFICRYRKKPIPSPNAGFLNRKNERQFCDSNTNGK